MSTHTFVDQLIGLAREYKKEVRLAIKRNRPIPAFGHEVAKRMIETGYFNKDEAKVFGDVLEGILAASEPTYKKKP